MPRYALLEKVRLFVFLILHYAKFASWEVEKLTFQVRLKGLKKGGR